MNDYSTQDMSTSEDDRETTDTVPTKVLDGLVEHVVDLNSTVPGADLGDLTALQDVFDDRRIVGLGEAAHGTQEFSQLKHRLLRFLVKELNIRLFGIEANFTETLALNRYVCSGEGDPKTALKGIYVWTWNTEEILALVKWIRTFNAGRAPDDKVKFYGFDMQHTKGVADAIVDYLDRVDPEYLAMVREDLAVLADPGLKLQETEGREERLASAERVVPDLRATFEERQANYVAQYSERSWELARQYVTVLGQATEFGTAVHTAGGAFPEEACRIRDRAMAENVAWILDYESADSIAVWAHNEHINRVKTAIGGYLVPSMGRYFTQWYGDAYYALGFEFCGGAFQAFTESKDEDWNYEVQKCSFKGPLPETLASFFHNLNHQLTFLNIRTAKEDPRLNGWLDMEHRLHSVSGSYDPEHPEKYVQTYVLTDAFDGLCYVEETTETCLIDDV